MNNKPHKFFQLEPEVPGELGDKTRMDHSIHPPKIESLEFLFKGWLGDCLIECFPIFLVMERTGQNLIENEMTGFSLKSVSVQKAYPFDEIHPNLDLPNFVWLQINGVAQESDFGIQNNLLVVSEKALKILQSESLNHCDIENVNN